jgi:hypothetical protein
VKLRGLYRSGSVHGPSRGLLKLDAAAQKNSLSQFRLCLFMLALPAHHNNHCHDNHNNPQRCKFVFLYYTFY